jgi:hypothetical protein
MTGRECIPETVVIGVEPAVIEWGTELSPVIRDMIPAVIETVKKEIAHQ